MEIEPERIPRAERVFEETRRIRWSVKPAGPLPILLFGLVGLALGLLLLFFMFWAFVVFAALGVLALVLNSLRSLLGGNKSPAVSKGRMFLSIERDPEFLKRDRFDDDL